jgi:hypothetical protein
MGKRTEPRRERVARVGIFWATRRGTTRRESSFMEDISSSGIALRSRLQFPVGFPLLIEMQDQVLKGTVCNCCRDGLDYRTGVKFAVPLPGLDGPE